VTDEIPGDVQRLLRDLLHTYEELEIVLLLDREKPRALSVSEVGAAVGIAPDAAGTTLATLIDRKLIARDDGSGAYRFGDSPDEIVRAVGELGRIWSQDRLPIVRLVTANAVERLRTGAARALSDAFLLPKGRKDG
jgi:hypothetical protein